MINEAQELYQIMSPMNIDSNKSKANIMITLDRPTNNEKPAAAINTKSRKGQ